MSNSAATLTAFRRLDADRISHRAFVVISALLFAASAASTIIWCTSMAAMPEMAMPGGWAMSMTWMRMPGQSWFVAASQFIAMWIVMMAAMMSPSLISMLWRYRRTIESRTGMHPDFLSALIAAGYFLFWSAIGLIVYALGSALAVAEMQSPSLARCVPVAGGAVIVAAGILQSTAWKAHHLACCRNVQSCETTMPLNAAAAWRHGLRLGLQCSVCCAGLTAILLVVGMMDLRAMAIVTMAIMAERFLPDGERTARTIGAVAIVVGLLQIIRTG